jgi:hypothetical protein
MNDSLLKQRRDDIVERVGAWTAHNIHLGEDVYTMEAGVVGDEIKLRRIFQIVSDVSASPLKSLRILDLACLEGMYGVEFARHGAEVVAIEGREVNIEKARFVKDVLRLETLTLVQDDVRNLNKEKYGTFDVILCLGILYHLDAPDVFRFLEAISQTCRKFLVIDTHISLAPEMSYVCDGKTYWGKTEIEHDPDASAQDKLKNLWMSLDNCKSFLFTQRSLLNILADGGFTSVLECHIPPEPTKPCNRVTLLAIKGEQGELLSAPLISRVPYERWGEIQSPHIHTRANRPVSRLRYRIGQYIKKVFGRRSDATDKTSH